MQPVARIRHQRNAPRQRRSQHLHLQFTTTWRSARASILTRPGYLRRRLRGRAAKGVVLRRGLGNEEAVDGGGAAETRRRERRGVLQRRQRIVGHLERYACQWVHLLCEVPGTSRPAHFTRASHRRLGARVSRSTSPLRFLGQTDRQTNRQAQPPRHGKGPCSATRPHPIAFLSRYLTVSLHGRQHDDAAMWTCKAMDPPPFPSEIASVG
jgi:hypothetical protein